MKEAAQPDAPPVEMDAHFTPKQVAKAWGCSAWTIKRMFKTTPGVLRRVSGNRVFISIPARILASFHRKLTEHSPKVGA